VIEPEVLSRLKLYLEEPLGMERNHLAWNHKKMKPLGSDYSLWDHFAIGLL
jgi:hypothetical protein